MNEKKLPCKETTKDFLLIESYLTEGKLKLAVREAGCLLEKVLHQIYQTLFFAVSYDEKKQIQEVELKIGKGKKGVLQFTLGEMIGLYRGAKLQKKWESYRGIDPILFSGIDLNAVKIYRNICTHITANTEKAEISRCQAELCISMIKAFLVATGHITDNNKKSKSIRESDAVHLWQLKDPRNLVIITANSSLTPTGEYLRPATGIGQVRALAYIINSLSRTYDNIGLKNIYLSTDHIHDRIENDLILLGGPKNNQITREFLNLLKEFQPADQVGSKIRWKDHFHEGSNTDFNEYCGQVADGRVHTDYGLIIRARNIFSNENRTAILIAGSHTYGTMAAAKYLVEKVLIEYNEELKSGMNFSILIRCSLRNEYPIGLAIEKKYFWTSN